MRRDVTRVLLPLDASEFGRESLDAVQSMLPRERTYVTIFHVGPQPRLHVGRAPDRPGIGHSGLHAESPERTIPAGDAPEVFDSQEWESAHQALLDAVDEDAAVLRRRGWTVEVAAAFGDPSHEIVEFARSHAIDLIAMATHARRGLARAVLGSVAEVVLREANVPLLLVRGSDLTVATETDAALSSARIEPA